MDRLNLRRDGFVLALLLVMIVLLVAALTGAYRVFGYGLVTFIGMMLGVGFARRRRPITWLPPVLATTVLLVAFTGIFVFETAPVHDPGDTVMGFQAATAFLVYGLWLPAYFTMGVSFALLFHHVSDTPDPLVPRSKVAR